MKKQPKHLYIHIPFCNKICTFCDFTRIIGKEEKKEKYINKICKQIEKKINSYMFNGYKTTNDKEKFNSSYKFKSIYIGGGTPNCLNNNCLLKLLSLLKKYTSKQTEFTIECNPEFVNEEQVKIFKQNDINRISLGIQTTNEKILKKYNREINIEIYEQAIKCLQNNGISNISCDFIYGFKELKKNDIDENIKFLKRNKIPHTSFYSLEVKEGSMIFKKQYRLNEKKIENELEYIKKALEREGYERYEVSSWCVGKKFYSSHNIGYWKMEEWIAIGLGGSGFENNTLYENVGNINTWKKKKNVLSLKKFYFYILMMGLRMKGGLDLRFKKNRLAYNFFSSKLKNVMILNNHLFCNNIDILNQTLIDCL